MLPCRSFLAILALALTACTQTIPGLAVSQSTVDFGTLPYKSAPKTELIRFFNGHTAARDLALTVTGPFQLDITQLHLDPHGGAIMGIAFDPQTEGDYTGTLRASAKGGVLNVSLSAHVSPPPDCGPATLCGMREFDPASQSCVTRPLRDGESCGAGLVCYGGECAGVDAPVGSACDTPCGSGTWTGDTCAVTAPSRIRPLVGRETTSFVRFQGLTDDQENLYWFEGPTLNLVSATRDLYPRYEIPLGTPSGNPMSLIAGDVLVTMENAGGLEARRLVDGSLAWRFPLSNELAMRMVADGGTLYLKSQDAFTSYLTAISATTGDVLWRHALDPSLARGFDVLGIAQGNLYTVLPNGDFTNLTALRPDGTTLWATAMSASVGPSLFADLGSRVLLAGTAYNAADGSRAWQVTSAEPVRSSGTSLYVMGLGDGLSKLNAETGALVWQRRSTDPDAVPLLTSRGVMLVGSHDNASPTLKDGLPVSEVSENGRLRYQCTLDIPATTYFTQDVALLHGLLVVSFTTSDPHTGGGTASLAAFPLPGAELAASGWVQNRGSPRQDYRSR